MSSITAVTYVVETAEERHRREQQEAWEVYAAQRAELTALRAEAQAYRDVFGEEIVKIPACPRASTRSAPAKITAAAGQARRIVDEYSRLLRESVAEAARRDTLRAIAGAVDSAPQAAGRAKPAREFTRRPTTEEQQEIELRQRAEEVRRRLVRRATETLALLPPQAPAKTRAACREAVAEISATESEARARLLLADLTRRVRREADAEQAVRRTRVALEELSAKLETVAGAEATAVRQEIARLSESRARQLPEGLADRVIVLVERANRAHRRKAVASAMRLSLNDLGYTVSEGFETVLVDQGAAYASAPDLPGYAVKVLLDTEQAALRTQVVRSDQVKADASTDIDAEKGFCAHYPDLLARLRKHGITSGIPNLRPPGQGAVAEVAENLLPVAAAGVRRQNAREMRR
ncbi:MAG TPA: hypothetical protein VJT49_34650 [Amycolatopsis sp.]|uniref:hypothetical protein n=1 Tax=Amycolatopsis sp. TaxID=37632 RepID=UPI002B45AF3A|nr:hypothetical protein [Amycolatopsis sp.]HKS50161.1 hypothetical protein [Amycolatopsis sp.]